MAVILSPRGNEASNMMKRFVRYEEAAQYFGIDETLIVAYAKAAGLKWIAITSFIIVRAICPAISAMKVLLVRDV